MSFLFRAFLFLSLFFLTYASAEEKWTIKKLDNLVFANVSGEITHGDQLGFFIRPESNCEKYGISLQFTLMKNLKILMILS